MRSVMSDGATRRRTVGLGAAVSIGFAAAIADLALTTSEAQSQSTQGEYSEDDSPAFRESALPIEEILSMFKAKGVELDINAETGAIMIYEIEREQGLYEVDVHDPERGRVELDINAETGEIMKEEVDD